MEQVKNLFFSINEKNRQKLSSLLLISLLFSQSIINLLNISDKYFTEIIKKTINKKNFFNFFIFDSL